MTKLTTKTELSQAERDAFATVGRIGGKATFKKHGKKHMSEIGRRGILNRWKKGRTKKSK